MGTRRYMLNGERLPSVTTVLGILNKPALVHWAWKLGTQGKNYKEVRGDAADVGTMCHEFWESWLTDLGTSFDDVRATKPPGEDVDHAFELFKKLAMHAMKRDWTFRHVRDMDGQQTYCEVALVSKTYGYGGTMDNVVEVDDKVMVFDLKTSRQAYPEHWHQLAAYAQLLEECCGLTVDGGMIGCVPRDGQTPTIYTCDDLTSDWEIFRSSLAVYKWRKERKAVPTNELSLDN